ncbi:MAG: hydrogenase expression/formation protein HypE [Sporomusaceae bacterium]|nr:hydrogenase expression/formation protein HypE [Sporomusaceae bacterium]
MKDKEFIEMAHGSGGRLSQELIESVMMPAFANEMLEARHDGAQFTIDGARLAFSTDSFVVSPHFFPGGNIGKLAVCGTVNDLAMNGAVPLYLSAGFIIAEGYPLADLKKIAAAMGDTAKAAGVQIVTGDTKVVERGLADGLYINTAGVGRILPKVQISADLAAPGQAVLISGTLGEHALAVMKERHGLTFPAEIVSDCAPLNGLAESLLAEVPEVAVLRDPTRGGLATTLCEIAEQAKVGILLDETAIPVRPQVQSICDLLGFDPLYLANEGKMIVLVAEELAEKALAVLRRHPYGQEAARIGQVVTEPAGQVGLRTTIGGIRKLDMLIGDQLPRIC